MKCPSCGNELKRSDKNPEYGLCYNCKSKFKWKEENTCENCGTVYGGNFCPECGCPNIKEEFSYTQLQEEPKKTKWYTKTWFVIVMLILFWPVGIFLMWKHKKNWNKVVKIIITAIFVISFIGNFLLDDSKEGVEPSPDSSESTNIVESDNVENDNTIDVEIDNCHVKFIKAEKDTNYVDEECIVIYYEFTNNSDEDKTFDYTIEDKAFQNGVELEASFFHVNDESKDSSAEIKPGVTITVASAFVPRDDSTVTLQVGRWILDNVDDEMTLELTE